MSSSEIVAELARLTHEERRLICQKIMALEADQDALETARQAAALGFQMLDQMEAEDEARRQAR
jgi:transcription elongation GreA/GreB family factor